MKWRQSGWESDINLWTTKLQSITSLVPTGARCLSLVLHKVGGRKLWFQGFILVFNCSIKFAYTALWIEIITRVSMALKRYLILFWLIQAINCEKQLNLLLKCSDFKGSNGMMDNLNYLLRWSWCIVRGNLSHSLFQI